MQKMCKVILIFLFDAPLKQLESPTNFKVCGTKINKPKKLHLQTFMNKWDALKTRPSGF